jgi:DNA polymerase I-like protein with 3'-5' exonuclease and polymerase domains
MTTLYLDIETTAEHPSKDGLLLAGWALDDGPVTVSRHIDGALAEWLADPDVPIVEHTKYDVRYLLLAGYKVAGDIHDTQVMAFVLNENTPLDLDWLSWRYADVSMDKRLRRTAGRVVFRADDGTDIDIAVLSPMAHPEAWAQFEAYCRRDVDALRQLHLALRDRLEESDWMDYWLREEVPYTAVLARMEARGLPVDLDGVRDLAEQLRPEADRLAAELLEEGGLPPSFNLNSGDQLAKYLFSRVVTLSDSLAYDTWTIGALKSCLEGEHDDCDAPGGLDIHVADCLPEGFTLDKLGRDRVHGHWTVKGRGLRETPPPVNKATGEKGKRPSTSSPDLLYMHAADPWVRKLCTEYRKVEKLLNTYLTRWPEEAVEGRLYGRFSQTGTVTGRLSSSGPNLQNIPARGDRGKQVRGLFRATEGKVLVVGDYDQLEMRLMAHLSGDRQLLRVFRDGLDPHVELAHSLFGTTVDPYSVPDGAAVSYRDAAKTLNYAMGYGAGPRRVAATLSLLGWPTTKDTATGYLTEMERLYRGLFRWKEQVIAKAKRKGSVATLGGRRRRLRSSFKDMANWKLVSYGERQAVNAIVQGTAADIIRRSMVLYDSESWTTAMPMLAQVHDEMVFEVLNVWDGWQGPTLQDMLDLARLTFETGHGFDLRVPLVFEPHVGHTWASAKGGNFDLAKLFEEDEAWDKW